MIMIHKSFLAVPGEDGLDPNTAAEIELQEMGAAWLEQEQKYRLSKTSTKTTQNWWHSVPAKVVAVGNRAWQCVADAALQHRRSETFPGTRGLATNDRESLSGLAVPCAFSGPGS